MYSTQSCLLLERRGGSLISHHIPGDTTAGWETEKHTHAMSSQWRSGPVLLQKRKSTCTGHTNNIYLWLWTLLDYWAAPEQTAIQTVLLLVQLALEPSPLAQVSEESMQGSQESERRRWNVDAWMVLLISGSYLTDGGVRPTIPHHNVGMEINVVQMHRSWPHRHGPAHFTCDALGSTWGRRTQSKSLHKTLRIRC